MYFYFSGAAPRVTEFLLSASCRSKLSLRLRTLKSYTQAFKHFLSFMLSHNIFKLRVPVQTLVAYSEFLVASHISHPTIYNKMSALKHMLSRFHWNLEIFDSPLLSNALMAIDLSVPQALSQKAVYSIADMHNLIRVAASHLLGLVFIPLFLLGFFAFLRISNLLQSSIHYDPHFTLR